MTKLMMQFDLLDCCEFGNSNSLISEI